MSMFKEELIIIRHARSAHNVGGDESLNAGITEWGEQQARNVALFLNEQFELSEFKLVTSPFLRCLLTSAPILERVKTSAEHKCHGKWRPYPAVACSIHREASEVEGTLARNPQFEVWPEFTEYLNHAGDNCFVEERGGQFPQFNWSRWPESKQHHKEHNEPFLNRIHEGFALLPQKSLVVTHGLPAQVLLEVATGNYHMPIWNFSIDNCSITYIKRGRIIWHGRNLFHEEEYDAKMYAGDCTVETTGGTE
jgi:broad specificity phosphatase PhoE